MSGGEWDNYGESSDDAAAAEFDYQDAAAGRDTGVEVPMRTVAALTDAVERLEETVDRLEKAVERMEAVDRLQRVVERIEDAGQE